MTQPDQAPEQRQTQIKRGTYIEKADTQSGDKQNSQLQTEGEQ